MHRDQVGAVLQGGISDVNPKVGWAIPGPPLYGSLGNIRTVDEASLTRGGRCLLAPAGKGEAKQVGLWPGAAAPDAAADGAQATGAQ